MGFVPPLLLLSFVLLCFPVQPLNSWRTYRLMKSSSHAPKEVLGGTQNFYFRNQPDPLVWAHLCW